MKKNNIFILNEIINVLQNHYEYNVTELLTTHCINADGSIDYDIKFTLEDSDKEEKEQMKHAQEEQTNIVKFGDIPEDFIPMTDNVPCACEPITEIEEIKPAPISKKMKKPRKMCGQCMHFNADTEECKKIPEKAVYSTKTINIDDCFESI